MFYMRDYYGMLTESDVKIYAGPSAWKFEDNLESGYL